jgi:hypothetical protein
MNQASKSSVNSKEHSSSEKIFQILHTHLIQPSLAASRYHHANSTASAFLAPASACHPIENDCKVSSFHSTFYLGSILEPDILSSSKTQYVSRFPAKNLPRDVFQWP